MRLVRTKLGATLCIVTSLNMAAGCHSLSDPSCATREELCNDHCRDCLFCPDVCTDPLRQESWYHCPTSWEPNCPPAGSKSGMTPSTLAKASDFFALPK